MKHIKRLFVTQRSVGGKMITIAAVKDTKRGQVLAGMTVLHTDDEDSPAKAEKVAIQRAVESPFYVTAYGTMSVKHPGVMQYLQEDILNVFYDTIQDILLTGLKEEGYFGIGEVAVKAADDTVKEEVCSKEK